MIKNCDGKRALKGFTLVELLVVIAIISVLMGLVFPALMGSRKKANQAACQSNLRQLHTSSMLYEQEERLFPFAGDGSPAYEHMMLLVTERFVEEPKLFICPASMSDREAKLDDDDNFELDETSCSYAWTNKPRSSSSRSRQRLSGDKTFGDSQHERGLNVVYVGGNVEFVKIESEDDSWDEITKGQLTK